MSQPVRQVPATALLSIVVLLVLIASESSFVLPED